ncbi:MAG: YdeI/OmpD-associated family protein [Candidatus Dadabacteria bacterium]
MNPKVDEFLDRAGKWQKEFETLRKIILACGLEEEFKWGNPCYTFEGNNIVLVHGFKDYCAVLFFKGALLNDPKGILIRQSENVQATRQVRFTNVQEITRLQKTLKDYIYESIEVEKAGLKVPLKKSSEYPVAEEFQKKLDKNPSLKKAFDALTPGRQRAYLLYFSAAKQSKTREERVKKCMKLILDGKGLDD